VEPASSTGVPENILIYADDIFHRAPGTFLDRALQRLGLAYKAHYDGDFDGFAADLKARSWDLVLFGNEEYLRALRSWMRSKATWRAEGS